MKAAVRATALLVVLFFVGGWLASSLPGVVKAGIIFSWPWLAASVVLLSAFLGIGALLWQHLTRTLHTDIRLGLAGMAWFYSQLGKYVPGKIFLYLARLYFYVREGRAAGPVALAVGLEVAASVIATALVVLFALSALALDEGGRMAFGLALAVGALLAMLHPRVLRGIVGLAARALRRPSFAVTVSYAQLLQLVALYFVNWLVFAAALYAFIRSFHPLEPEAIVYVSGSFALATLVGMFAFFVPAGLGVREGLLAVLLSRVMPEPLAVVGAVATRVWFTLVELACLGVVAMVAGRGIPRPTSAELDRLAETTQVRE